MKTLVKNWPILLLILLPLLALRACHRTVEWEEEVPLNTGETIVVKRSGVYAYHGLTSDGSHFRYVPEWRSTIEFTYKGKRYTHTDDVKLILLVIGPDEVPNLVASPGSDWSWKNKYYCVTPSYVQFRPDSTGQKWTWPERIDPWLYGLPINLMFGLAPLEDSGKKFTPKDRALQNSSLTVMYNHLRNIDPTYSTDNCLPRR